MERIFHLSGGYIALTISGDTDAVIEFMSMTKTSHKSCCDLFCFHTIVWMNIQPYSCNTDIMKFRYSDVLTNSSDINARRSILDGDFIKIEVEQVTHSRIHRAMLKRQYVYIAKPCAHLNFLCCSEQNFTWHHSCMIGS
jgi:hypothetical protein